MRTTIALDDDIYQSAQHLSRVSGERLGKVISKLARRGLERKGPSARKRAQRFPTFEIPAGAPIIPASRIERVLDEESLF
jgi:Arc/MetJ family transcription regulator